MMRFITWIKRFFIKNNEAPKPIIVKTPIERPDNKFNNVVLVIGHNAREQGADNYLGESEYSFNKRIAIALNIELIKNGINSRVISRPITSYFQQCRSAAKDAENFGADLALCLHFNSYNHKTQGCEALIIDSDDKVDNFLAKTLTDILSREYGLYERGDDGVKTLKSSHNGYGMLSALKNKGIPAVLIEPIFADNKYISAKFFADETRYVAVLLEGICAAMKGE